MKRYKNIHGDNIILLYSGDLTFDLLNAMTACLEGKLSALQEEKKVKKRFYGVAMECLQNLYYHIEEATPDEVNIGDLETKSVTVVVYLLKRFLVIQTSNFIPQTLEKVLIQKIDDVNSKSPEELRLLYQQKLSNEEFSDKGTAGLGYIDIARKSTQKLEYLFQKVNENYSLFTFTVHIPRSSTTQQP